MVTTAQHNASEQDLLFDLFERERWLLGEQLRRDPRDDWRDMALLENRVSQLILEGFGRWLAEVVKPVESQTEVSG